MKKRTPTTKCLEVANDEVTTVMGIEFRTVAYFYEDEAHAVPPSAESTSNEEIITLRRKQFLQLVKKD